MQELYLLNGSPTADNSVSPKCGPQLRLQEIALDVSRHGKNVRALKLKINAPESLLDLCESGDDHFAFVKPPMQSPSLIYNILNVGLFSSHKL